MKLILFFIQHDRIAFFVPAVLFLGMAVELITTMPNSDHVFTVADLPFFFLVCALLGAGTFCLLTSVRKEE